jgi:hypothetical protein
VRGSRLELARGGADGADATIASDTGTLAQVLWHGRPLADAEAAGAVEIGGDRAAAERFLDRFPPPR